MSELRTGLRAHGMRTRARATAELAPPRPPEASSVRALRSRRPKAISSLAWPPHPPTAAQAGSLPRGHTPGFAQGCLRQAHDFEACALSSAWPAAHTPRSSGARRTAKISVTFGVLAGSRAEGASGRERAPSRSTKAGGRCSRPCAHAQAPPRNPEPAGSRCHQLGRRA